MKRLIVSLLTLIALQTSATEIPVFRYALERWIPEAYTLIITHHDNLNEDQKKLLSDLDKVSETFLNEAYYGAANLTVKAINPTKELPSMSERDQEFVKKAFNGAFSDTPQFALISPYPEATVWIDDFNTDNLKYLINSPVRQAIAHHIMRGITGVWLMVDGTDDAVNDAKEKELRTHSAAMKDEIPPPKIGDSYKYGRHYVESKIPLLLEFEVIRIKADNPKEKCLLQILKNPAVAKSLSIKAEDIGVKPLAIPLFGRGRSFYGLIGDDIKQENIFHFCTYLLGNCSCQVKMQNPGIDFLFDAKWLLMVAGKVDVPALPEPSEMEAPEPKVVNEPTETRCETACELCPLGRYRYLIAGALLIALLASVLIYRKKKNASKE